MGSGYCTHSPGERVRVRYRNDHPAADESSKVDTWVTKRPKPQSRIGWLSRMYFCYQQKHPKDGPIDRPMSTDVLKLQDVMQIM